MNRLFPLLAALLLGGCAAYSGRGLVPGSAGLAEVIGVMGEPAMRWPDAARFSVLFDGASSTVRTTMRVVEASFGSVTYLTATQSKKHSGKPAVFSAQCRAVMSESLPPSPLLGCNSLISVGSTSLRRYWHV